MSFVWSRSMPPVSMDWWLENQSKSGGVSILGNERIVVAPSARWRATMTFWVAGSREDPRRVLYWRAAMSAARGRSGTIIIGPFDQFTPAALAGVTAVGLPHSDGAPFSDGSLYYGGGTMVRCTTGAARGATAITAVVYKGSLTPGQYFSVGTRLYLISAISMAEPIVTLTFSPPLRDSVENGQPLEFDNPVCAMRLTADDVGRAELKYGRVANATLDLVEVF